MVVAALRRSDHLDLVKFNGRGHRLVAYCVTDQRILRSCASYERCAPNCCSPLNRSCRQISAETCKTPNLFLCLLTVGRVQ